MKRQYVVGYLQACELDEIVPSGRDEAFYDDGVVASVVEWEDGMGFPRVNVFGPDRQAVLDFVREVWGDDEATGGWYSEYVVGRIIEEVVV